MEYRNWQELAIEELLEYQMLIAELKYHKHLYYCKTQPVISDTVYDQIQARITAISKEHGWPTWWVGCKEHAEEC